MNIYEAKLIADRIRGNSYVGRGIVLGKTPDGTKCVTAYFIMGRSENSRNRVFTQKGDNIYTEPFDVSKVEDPSLIIYRALGHDKNRMVVTNGDQTDTVLSFLAEGKSFAEALTTREFEPDAPNFTPRISGMATFADGDFSYEMSILKSEDAAGSACARYHYSYKALAGLGHFIHTYVCDGTPIPTFQGEPERIATVDDIDVFTQDLWNALDESNKISLYVRYTDRADGTYCDRMINRNGKDA